MSKNNDWKYTSKYGFIPTIKKGTKYVNNRPIKKVKMSIPALKFEKIFLSVNDCADELNVREGLIYTYLKTGRAARGILKFEYIKDEEEIF